MVHMHLLACFFADLLELIMHWGNAHPVAAKVMTFLPLFVLPAVAIVLQRRRNRISRGHATRGA